MALKPVRWLRSALASLDEIVEIVAADKPSAAAALAERILETASLLARYPELGRVGRVAGVREIVIPGTPYILFYRRAGPRVEILRVRHGAMRNPIR